MFWKLENRWTNVPGGCEPSKVGHKPRKEETATRKQKPAPERACGGKRDLKRTATQQPRRIRPAGPWRFLQKRKLRELPRCLNSWRRVPFVTDNTEI